MDTGDAFNKTNSENNSESQNLGANGKAIANTSDGGKKSSDSSKGERKKVVRKKRSVHRAKNPSPVDSSPTTTAPAASSTLSTSAAPIATVAATVPIATAEKISTAKDNSKSPPTSPTSPSSTDGNSTTKPTFVRPRHRVRKSETNPNNRADANAHVNNGGDNSARHHSASAHSGQSIKADAKPIVKSAPSAPNVISNPVAPIAPVVSVANVPTAPSTPSAETAPTNSSAVANGTDANASNNNTGKTARRRRRRGRRNRGASSNPPNSQVASNPPVAPIFSPVSTVSTVPIVPIVPNGGDEKKSQDANGASSASSASPTQSTQSPQATSSAPNKQPNQANGKVAANSTNAVGGRKMLLNVIDREQARVAIIGKNGLEELYIEKAGGEFVHGNIFKGRVVNIQPNLQAAFIDIGAEKNAFLHADDVIPPFGGYEDILKRRRKKAPSDSQNLQNMKINDKLVEGQELIVQITREALPTKGPSVTTYVSLPGRYLVMMPANKTRGVSKKITNQKQRHELRAALEKLAPSADVGFIIRTAGMGKGTEELQFDLDALGKLWQDISAQARTTKAPQILYHENELTIRAIRDYCRNDIEELIIDRREEYARAVAFIKLAMPDFYQRTKLYDRKEPLFSAHRVEADIEQLFSRSVKLPSGGEILIEQTESMIAIDVNTGKFVKAESTREMIKTANLEAAEAIGRQLRLRDMGGLVMIDFIDMELAEDRRAVENAMRAATKVDRARITILPISSLGIMEMTRQRLRQSLLLAHYQDCPHCGGSGKQRKVESLGSELLRRLRIELGQKKDRDITIRFSPATALAIANDLRGRLTELENEFARKITIAADNSFALDQFAID